MKTCKTLTIVGILMGASTDGTGQSLNVDGYLGADGNARRQAISSAFKQTYDGFIDANRRYSSDDWMTVIEE